MYTSKKEQVLNTLYKFQESQKDTENFDIISWFFKLNYKQDISKLIDLNDTEEIEEVLNILDLVIETFKVDEKTIKNPNEELKKDVIEKFYKETDLTKEEIVNSLNEKLGIAIIHNYSELLIEECELIKEALEIKLKIEEKPELEKQLEEKKNLVITKENFKKKTIESIYFNFKRLREYADGFIGGEFYYCTTETDGISSIEEYQKDLENIINKDIKYAKDIIEHQKKIFKLELHKIKEPEEIEEKVEQYLVDDFIYLQLQFRFESIITRNLIGLKKDKEKEAINTCIEEAKKCCKDFNKIVKKDKRNEYKERFGNLISEKLEKINSDYCVITQNCSDCEDELDFLIQKREQKTFFQK